MRKPYAADVTVPIARSSKSTLSPGCAGPSPQSISSVTSWRRIPFFAFRIIASLPKKSLLASTKRMIPVSSGPYSVIRSAFQCLNPFSILMLSAAYVPKGLIPYFDPFCSKVRQAANSISDGTCSS